MKVRSLQTVLRRRITVAERTTSVVKLSVRYVFKNDYKIVYFTIVVPPLSLSLSLSLFSY